VAPAPVTMATLPSSLCRPSGMATLYLQMLL
jgi:hypothetical protein